MCSMQERGYRVQNMKSCQLYYQMQNKTHIELIEIVEKQNDIIAALVNENTEKENMINVLMTEFKE